jgi:hypothetical protein
MPTAESTAPEFTLTLTAEERTQLLNLLQQVDRDTLIEAHRTDSLDYKQYVERKEAVLRGLIDKLRRP